jgi:hypothetical protein
MTRRGPVSSDVVVRLYEEAWQRWKLSGGSPQLLANEEVHADGATRVIHAVPARRVIATPLWIEGADAALAPETVKLELEVRGLLPRAQAMGGTVVRLLPQENRQLAVVATFPPELPEENSLADAYDVSPFLLDLPSDAVTLWREGDDLVAAFTRGEAVVYWETIDRSVPAEELQTWLGVLNLRLRGEAIIDRVPKVVSWVEGLPAARIAPAGCEATGAAPDSRPSLKHARFEWKPVSAQQADLQRLRREQIKRVVLIVAAIYVVIAAGFTLYFGALRWKISRLANETTQLKAEVEKFQPIARDWTMIAPTVEPEQYPLEILSGVVTGMPPQGIRLIRFKIEGGAVGVEGEADTFQMATDFYNALATAEGFRGFNLQSDTPQMKANNAASFNIHGAIPPP